MGVTYTSAFRLLKLIRDKFPEVKEGVDVISKEVTRMKNDGSKIKNRINFLANVNDYIFDFCVKNEIDIKIRELNLINFPYFLGGVNVFKLDTWLYNNLISKPNRIGLKYVHDMSGMEKLNEYTKNNKLFARIVMGGSLSKKDIKSEALECLKI